MIKKPGIGETIFARLFNIVAGKDYLVSVEWDARRGSRFFPLNAALKKSILLGVAVVCLGVACLIGECATWMYREFSLQYCYKENTSLKTELNSVLEEQGSVENSLDSLSRLEEKIRALYGMNGHDKAFLAFGVGGRRPDVSGQPFGYAVSEQILNSSLKNRQLQSKISFTSSSFKQIEEFVRYRHNLWEHTPFVLPAKGQITSGFGIRLHPITGSNAMHEGLDIANSRWTPIYATADGIVVTCNQSGNFGNLVVLDHGNGYTTKFGHMTKIMVEKGQLVKRYGLIGYMGDSGRATGIHLHYEVHRDGTPQNPEKYILPSGILVD
ncbi:MAG TPA: M23 family metallopeptidase [Fibrobacteria bacterium]|nr:M23 family metallopeptidase [Fibrobacteria bacterium]